MASFLILGGDSRLGKCFKSLYPNECIPLSKKQCDITQAFLLDRIIKQTNCPYILNCAAITDTEECEKNPALCFAVNSFSVYALSKICLKYNKKLIHISSNAAVRPINMYGWSKFLSEKMTKPSGLVIRTDFYDEKTYIVKNLMAQNAIVAYSNVYFNPISINYLVHQIYIQKDRTGIINIFTNEKISFYEFAGKFCDIFSLDKSRLVKDHTPRPLNLFVKSTIKRGIARDLIDFKKFMNSKK
mgnify:CR=1 FL=1